MAGEGGAKKGGIEKMIFELGLQNTFFSYIKTRLILKFEIFISKIERVTSIFVGQVESKSHINKSFNLKISVDIRPRDLDCCM